jgi:predicted Zn finger-like uncharacterized protein
MAHQLETTHVFLDDHRRGVVMCPHCGDTHAVNMARYPAPLGGQAYRVRCGACGHRFRLLFESRRHLRIPTHLPGWLLPAAPQAAADEGGHKLGDPPITVTSLSTGGIGFRTQSPVSYTVGARYHVLFVLPDTPQTLISEDIIIRRSDAQGGGAEFCRPPGSNHALDWYIYVTSTGAAPPVEQAPVPRHLSGARGKR